MTKITKTLKKSLIILGSLSIPTIAISTVASCSVSKINKFEYITPVIKDSINLNGQLNFILGNDGSKTTIEQRLQTIIDKDKSLVLSNFKELADNKQNLDIAIKNQSGDDLKWGSQPYSEWANDVEEQNIKTWNGINSKDPNEIIKVDSKMGLKKYLTDNLSKIEKNLGIDSSNNLILPDVSISSDNENLLIPLLLQSSSDNETATGTKYILKIPFTCINLDFKILVVTEPNSSNAIRKEVNVTYKTTSSKVQNKVFENYEDIVLDELQQTSTNKIDVYNNISDNQILKKLGWIDTDIKNHEDGSEISIDILKKDKVLKDLKLNENNLISLNVVMENRNPTLDKYNGTFTINANVLTTNNNENNIVTYAYNKSVDESSQVGQPLQLMVPDAYILQSRDDSKEGQARFTKISFLDGKQFGFHYINSQGTKNMIEGFNKPNTSKKLNKLIEELLESKKIKGSNGINYYMSKFDYSEATGNLFIYTISPKQGFTFKSSFEFNNKKYNVESQTTTAYFSGYIEGIESKAAFIQVKDSSVDEMEKYYETHDYFSKELFESWKQQQNLSS